MRSGSHRHVLVPLHRFRFRRKQADTHGKMVGGSSRVGVVLIPESQGPPATILERWSVDRLQSLHCDSPTLSFKEAG